MKRALPWIAGIVGLLVVLAAVPMLAMASAFVGNRPVPDQDTWGGVTLVKDSFVTAYLLDAGPGAVALIDCGQAPGAVSAALKAEGLGDDAVKAVFLTHGHGDHAGGCKAFPQASVYAIAEEVPLVTGKAASHGPLPSLMGAQDAGVVPTPLTDGQSVTVGTLTVTAYAVPGHTVGSAVYLADDALFFGDSAGADSSGGLKGAPWVFSDDQAQNVASLKALPAKLGAAKVDRLYFGHTGPLDGRAALDAFAGAK